MVKGLNALTKQNLEAIIKTMEAAESLGEAVAELDIVFEDTDSRGRLIKTTEGWVYRPLVPPKDPEEGYWNGR